jgi:hypothetical protein
MRSTTLLRAAGGGGCLLGLLGLLGCSDPGAEVTGTVRFDGVPLTGGKVTFFHPTRPGRNVTAYIQTDGTYRILAVPTGQVKVTVVVLPPQQKDRDKKRAAAARLKVPAVPSKYTDPATTELIYRVEPGSQTIDIELRPG